MFPQFDPEEIEATLDAIRTQRQELNHSKLQLNRMQKVQNLPDRRWILADIEKQLTYLNSAERKIKTLDKHA